MRSREEIQKEIEFNQRIQLEAAQERSRTSSSGITRIGDRDGQTGRWQALTARGVREGIKTFNTSVASGTLVRGIPTPGGAIALDQENIIGTPPPPEVIAPVSWVRVWVTRQSIFVGGTYPHQEETQTAYFQIKGKPSIVLLSSFISSFEFQGSGFESMYIQITGLSVVTPALFFVELRLSRNTAVDPGISTFRNLNLRYLVRGDGGVVQLASHSYIYTSLDSPRPDPELPQPLRDYDDYINRDPFNVTGFGYTPDNDSRFPPERQVYPQARRYHAYFGKELFYTGAYALAPRGLGRQINELTETVKGSGRGAKYYAWALKIDPVKIAEYIRRSPINERGFWEQILRLGGKIPAALGYYARTGSEPRAIAPITGLTGILDLNFFSKLQDSAIFEAYEIEPSIPPSYAFGTTGLPFYSIPGFAKKIGQTAIDFDDPLFAEQYGLSEQSYADNRLSDSFRTRQMVLKAIV